MTEAVSNDSNSAVAFSRGWTLDSAKNLLSHDENEHKKLRPWDRAQRPKKSEGGKQRTIWKRYETRQQATKGDALDKPVAAPPTPLKVTKKVCLTDNIVLPKAKHNRHAIAARWDRRGSGLPHKLKLRGDISLSAPESRLRPTSVASLKTEDESPRSEIDLPGIKDGSINTELETFQAGGQSFDPKDESLDAKNVSLLAENDSRMLKDSALIVEDPLLTPETESTVARAALPVIELESPTGMDNVNIERDCSGGEDGHVILLTPSKEGSKVIGNCVDERGAHDSTETPSHQKIQDATTEIGSIGYPDRSTFDFTDTNAEENNDVQIAESAPTPDTIEDSGELNHSHPSYISHSPDETSCSQLEVKHQDTATGSPSPTQAIFRPELESPKTQWFNINNKTPENHVDREEQIDPPNDPINEDSQLFDLLDEKVGLLDHQTAPSYQDQNSNYISTRSRHEDLDQLHEETTTITVQLNDDTDVLMDFLNRANASKAARIAQRSSISHRRDSDVIKQALSSPRKPLDEIDVNSPAMGWPHENIETGSPTPVRSEPEQDLTESLEDPNTLSSSDAMPTRRSNRIATPKARKIIPPTRSAISIRHGIDANTLLAKRSEAQELALLTRTNTKRNKADSVPAKIRLLGIQDGLDEDSVQDETDARDRAVRWNEELVHYFTEKKQQAERTQPKSRIVRTKALNGLAGPSVKSEEAIKTIPPSHEIETKHARRGRIPTPRRARPGSLATLGKENDTNAGKDVVNTKTGADALLHRRSAVPRIRPVPRR